MWRCRSATEPRSVAFCRFGRGALFFFRLAFFFAFFACDSSSFSRGPRGGSGNRSRAWMAVESRDMCPIKRSFCVERTTASCNFRGSSVSAKSANARENVDSWGTSERCTQPQSRRSCRLLSNSEIRSRVVEKWKTAFAMKAAAKTHRFSRGRPMRFRSPSQGPSGAIPSTCTNNCALAPSGPISFSRAEKKTRSALRERSSVAVVGV